MKPNSRRIMSLALLGVLGIGGMCAAAVQGSGIVEGAREGRQMWAEYPTEGTGFYYMYDDTEDAPPFSDLPPLPPGPYSDYTLHDNPEAIKLDPYNDAPYKLEMPDSFYYFGDWYEPEDYIYFSPDGKLSFDVFGPVMPGSSVGSMTPNCPFPPDTIPHTDDPNSIMAPLWYDYNPLLDTGDVDNNRQYYWYDTTENKLWFEWYKVKQGQSEREYTFLASLQLGGMELMEEIDDACGLIESHHYIDFYYETCSETWDADSAATGIEDYTGERGIYYGEPIETTEDSFHVVRAGYRKVHENDVGVYDIEHTPFGDDPPWVDPGSEIINTALVENYGLNPEYDIMVRCRITDVIADPDTVVYENVQNLSFLDRRGNPDGNPYRTEVEFPRWVVPSSNGFIIWCSTELEMDECSDNDSDSYIIYGITEEEGIQEFALTTPEIVRTECVVSFTIPEATWARIEVFDVNGRRVRTLENDAYSPGRYQTIWNLRDGQGRRVSSGVYFVRLRAGEASVDQRVIVVR